MNKELFISDNRMARLFWGMITILLSVYLVICSTINLNNGNVNFRMLIYSILSLFIIIILHISIVFVKSNTAIKSGLLAISSLMPVFSMELMAINTGELYGNGLSIDSVFSSVLSIWLFAFLILLMIKPIKIIRIFYVIVAIINVPFCSIWIFSDVYSNFVLLDSYNLKIFLCVILRALILLNSAGTIFLITTSIKFKKKKER